MTSIKKQKGKPRKKSSSRRRKNVISNEARVRLKDKTDKEPVEREINHIDWLTFTLRMRASRFRDALDRKDFNRSLITCHYDDKYLKDVKEQIAKEDAEVKRINETLSKKMVDKVKREISKVEGKLGEGAMATMLAVYWSKEGDRWQGVKDKLADDYDFELLTDGEIVLTIDVKSATYHNEKKIDLQVNVGTKEIIPKLKDQIIKGIAKLEDYLSKNKNKKSDIYVLTQVPDYCNCYECKTSSNSETETVNILGYATYDDLKQAFRNNQIQYEDYYGKPIDPYIKININKLHTIEELGELFSDRLGVAIKFGSNTSLSM